MSDSGIENENALASVFHEGEQAAQLRVGVRDSIKSFANQAIRNFMPEQHREFYSQLPYMIVSSTDKQGRPWATMLTGSPGFTNTPDPRQLNINAAPVVGDALEHAFVSGAKLGLLGIKLDSRRRNRINGTLRGVDKDSLSIEVDQSFGNCPQYISKRFWKTSKVDEQKVKTTQHAHLTQPLQSWIESADTLFIASGYRNQNLGEQSMDVSHRGGPAGFVKVVNHSMLVIPDYAGNNFFNTIGNLMVNPEVGLLFVDFTEGSLLQITGKAVIDWDSDDVENYPGAKRLIKIEIDHIVHLEHVLPLRWSEAQSPARELRVVNKTPESKNVTSFEFAARDGGKLPEFKAGQYLPIELRINDNEILERTYSLSNSPEQGRYRISVKREPKGVVSNLLHDQINHGDIVVSKLPEGDFVLKQSDRPVVLVSTGIGITPMVSMLNALAGSNKQVYFFHGARNSTYSPLADEVRDIVSKNSNLQLIFTYSQPLPEDIKGRHYDHLGRIDVPVIKQYVHDLDAEFYLCGSKAFLLSVESKLLQHDVGQADIYTESF